MWKYVVRRRRVFRRRTSKCTASGGQIFQKTKSKYLAFVCLTSFVLLTFFSIIRENGLRRIVVLGGKIACNTFCPAAFYEKPLYYYDGNTHPAVIVFGNIFPVVRLMAAGAVGAEDTEAQVGAAPADGIAYMEFVNAQGEGNPDGDGKYTSANGTNYNGDGEKTDGNGDGTGGNYAVNGNGDGTGGTYSADGNTIGNGDSTSNGNRTTSNHNTAGTGNGTANGNGTDSNRNTTGNNNNTAANDNETSTGDNSGYGIPAGSIPLVSALVPYTYDRLINFNFVHDNFYVIPAHTALSSDLLKPKEFLETDLSVSGKTPCILIYHTHSQEAFADSKGSDMTIVQVGDYLEQLLREKYGFEVIHITTEFDMIDGNLDRSKAYTYAEQQLTAFVSEHPEIDMVIDLHRDGVNDNLHFVTDINGKPTAKVMLFNGISYSNNQGTIDYLYNPYLKENLALTYQMYLLGKTYYPDFFRCIYIEAYRYNLHLCKRSMLIEAGAQTNSFEEVKNAMEPLSELIARELYGEKIIK